MTQSISGLGSGLDTNSIIAQLVSIERQSQNLVKARATKAQTSLATYDAIRSQLAEVKTASSALRTAADWRPLSATSSDTDIATVSAGTGTFGGTISFTVNSLARAGTVRSANVISGTATAVNADAAILVAAGGAKLGFASFASDNALALGAHDIQVTQTSAAAVKNGTSALAASTVVSTSNNNLNMQVNGVVRNLTIANGTYDRTQLAAAIQTAANAIGSPITVTVDSATNALKITTTREGSQATVRVTGGDSLASLQLTTDGSAIAGTDGKTQIGSAPEQTWNSIDVGGTATLNASAGSISAVFSDGLRVGTVKAKNVSAGDGSLATVVANINAAGAGVTATAVQVGDSTYRLQLTSNTVGALHGQSIAAAEFNATVGGLTTLTAASDANLTVGSGAGAYTVTSASNTVSNLLPGVTVTLKGESATPVTISATRDASALAERVQALVDAANKVKKSVDAATHYDKDTNKPSPLTGDSVARRILADLNRAITDATSWTTPGSPGLAGLSVDKTGQFTFDASKFSEAFNADPEGMTRLFTQGGTASDSKVTFISAGDRARPGTYAVQVTTVPTQAASTGLTGSWPMGSPPTIKVRVGTNEITYAVGATDVQSTVVNALNTRFATADLALTASINGTGIKITANDYGTSGNFEVAWTGGAYTPVTGTNIAGTIDGVTATGTGRQLGIAFDHATLGGLALEVAATTTGPHGTFEYQPGVAQRAATMLGDATDIVTGYITSSENALKSRVKFIDSQVASMEQRLLKYEARLKRQFALLESTLGMLRQQSDWLAGQVGSLSANQG